MKKKSSAILVGGFVVVAVLLGAIMTIVLATGGLSRDTDRFVVYFDYSGHGLDVGAAVKFQGVEVGRVSDIDIVIPDPASPRFAPRVPVVLEIDENRIETEGGRSPFTDPAKVRELVARGMRAQLQLESPITGLRFVELEMAPDSPATLVAGGDTPYPEIPAIPGLSERLETVSQRLLSQVASIDLPALFDSLMSLSQRANDLLGSPELDQAVERLGDIATNLDGAISEFRRVAQELGPRGAVGSSFAQAAKSAARLSGQSEKVVGSLERILDPTGPIYGQLDATLAEVQQAARSVRRLADQLSRNPGSILRGGRQ
jgi:paraquat-inducible protein B